MKLKFNDPYLDVMHIMTQLKPVAQEVLREYAINLKAAYAEKEREDNEPKTKSGKA